MSSTPPAHRIVVSKAVARELRADQLMQVRLGGLMKPEYRCPVCHQPGDTRTDESSAILLTSETSMVLNFAHAACEPSEVHTIAEWEERYPLFRALRTARPDDETTSAVAKPKYVAIHGHRRAAAKLPSKHDDTFLGDDRHTPDQTTR